jgi:dienelactone hydrolase
VLRGAGLLLAVVALGLPAAATAYDPAREQANYDKQNERATYDFDRPERAQATNLDRLTGVVEVAGIALQDPGRSPLTLCGPRINACAGDTRVYDWGGRFGLALPVTWVNRQGAVISGTLWSGFGPDGRAAGRMPSVVITPGGAGSTEAVHFKQAALLARRGYQVLTWDPQGQGRSDALGTGGTLLGGVPSEEYDNFRDGLVDAIDFLQSDPCAPYAPRGPDAARTKQRERAAAGTSATFNPLHALLDHERCGVAGHSFGAVAASEVASTDDRVDALVAWDWLAPDVCDVYETGDQAFCFGAPRRPLTPRVPALNVAADYGFDNVPYVADPDPDARGRGFAPYRAAGRDVMSVIVRGGSHYECPYIPNPLLSATLRGEDLCAWYTLAWFDKYLHDDPSAVARLLSDRWRHDARGAAIDAAGDGNLLSFYFRSRVDVGLTAGGRARCDDLRAGCAELVPAAQDGFAGEFDALAQTRTLTPLAPRAGATAGACPDAPAAGSALGLPVSPCRSRRRFTIRLRGRALVSARVYVDGRRVRTLRGRRLRARIDLRGLPRRTATVSVVARTRAGRVVRETRRYRTCVRRHPSSRASRPASSRTGTFRRSAFSSFEPADSPATR